MEKWLTDGVAPPPSRYPRLADGTLVAAAKVAFPTLPGVQSPTVVEQHRRDGTLVPFLVPQVDADGNERAGIRTPESLVPLATYTGWNFRNASIGGTKTLVSLLGARIPLPKTAAERTAAGDPRRSIAERYASKAAYLSEAQRVAADLVRDGYLLAGDADKVLRRMDEQWMASSDH